MNTVINWPDKSLFSDRGNAKSVAP